jgi:hypothetical protein
VKKKKTTQDAGNGEPGTGDREWSRRSWLGAVAGALAAVTTIRRTRGEEAVAEKRRRNRFWIGHG